MSEDYPQNSENSLISGIVMLCLLYCVKNATWGIFVWGTNQGTKICVNFKCAPKEQELWKSQKNKKKSDSVTGIDPDEKKDTSCRILLERDKWITHQDTYITSVLQDNIKQKKIKQKDAPP